LALQMLKQILRSFRPQNDEYCWVLTQQKKFIKTKILRLKPQYDDTFSIFPNEVKNLFEENHFVGSRQNLRFCSETFCLKSLFKKKNRVFPHGAIWICNQR
ncbi:MAG: hypothetical protein ACI4B8_00935, partial [Candidatus Gastranaerophilaceae bacterium]